MKLRAFILVIVAAALLTGCVKSVFNAPVALSTKSHAAQYAKPAGKVSTEITNGLVILIPIVHDPRDTYDGLPRITKEKGGNAVIDMPWHDKSAFMRVFPGIVSDTWELKGTAVRIE